MNINMKYKNGSIINLYPYVNINDIYVDIKDIKEESIFESDDMFKVVNNIYHKIIKMNRNGLKNLSVSDVYNEYNVSDIYTSNVLIDVLKSYPISPLFDASGIESNKEKLENIIDLMGMLNDEYMINTPYNHYLNSSKNKGDSFTIHHTLFGDITVYVIDSDNESYTCIIPKLVATRKIRKNNTDVDINFTITSPLFTIDYQDDLIYNKPDPLLWLNSDDASGQWMVSNGYLNVSHSSKTSVNTLLDYTVDSDSNTTSVISLPGFLSGFDDNFLNSLIDLDGCNKFRLPGEGDGNNILQYAHVYHDNGDNTYTIDIPSILAMPENIVAGKQGYIEFYNDNNVIRQRYGLEDIIVNYNWIDRIISPIFKIRKVGEN